MTGLTSRRRSPLSGAFNFRDLGGLPTTDGRRTRHGLLYRSDTLQALTPEDVRVLVDQMGIGMVLDLRGAGETISEGRAVLHRQCCHLNVPLLDVDVVRERQGPPLAAAYVDHLEHDRNLPMAVELLAHALSRPTVVHCAAGKDRTGVVIALALGLAGVTTTAIVDDYLCTAPNMERIVARFETWPRYRGNMRRLPPDLYRCERGVITALVEVVRDRYGGFDAWARQAGVSQAARSALGTRLIDDQADEPG